MQLNGFKDYFKILGIGRNANDKEIQSAFRRLVREFHSDLDPHDEEAGTKFKGINKADKILSYQKKKVILTIFKFLVR